MSQNDFNIANQGFPSFRSDLNSALQALASTSSGATAPATTYANQLWYDTSTGLLKIRNEANSDWVDAFNTLGIAASPTELNILDGASTTQAPLVLAQPSAFVDPENRIINGAFDFWQRGTSFTAQQYGADRWYNGGGGGTVTQSRQSHTVGDKFGVNSPAFYLRQAVSGQSLASHFANFRQLIEGVRSYAGETITVLGWVRRSSGSGNMTIEGVQDFGTGGSPSSSVNAINPTTITLTTSWQPFAAVLTVPSIAGKTLGTDGNDHLGINFWTSAGSNFNARTNSLGIQTIGVDLWGIHIKRGTHTAAATEFYKAPELGPELARCQRYYEKSYNITTNPGTNTGIFGSIEDFWAGTGGVAVGRVRFAVSKRGAPTMVVYDAVGTTNTTTTFAPTQNNGQGPTAVDNIGNSGFKVFMSQTNIIRITFHWAADAEL